MPYNNLKSLVRRFGFRKFSLLCKEKDWKIPSLEDVRKHKDELEHDECWVSDMPPKRSDRETHAMLYDKKQDKLFLVNKNNMYPCVVWSAVWSVKHET